MHTESDTTMTSKPTTVNLQEVRALAQKLYGQCEDRQNSQAGQNVADNLQVETLQAHIRP